MSYDALPSPTGSTPAQQYAWSLNFTTQLRRILVDLGSAVNPDVTQALADIAALQGTVSSLSSQTATNTSGIASLSTTVSGLSTGLATANGNIISLQTAVDPLTPQFFAEHALVHAADDVLGSLSEVYNRTLTQNETNALATINAAIEAHRATNGVRSQVSVTDGHAELITALNSQIGVTNANVTALQTTVADGDAALAADITAVETTVAGNTASITAVQSSVNGVRALYGVSINAQGEVIGAIQLDGTALGSAFTVAVDKFQVAKAGTTGGGAVPVFAISTVNGVAKITFVGDMFADGAIAARMMAANSVTANSILAGAVTAAKINVADLSAITANLGTVTAGLIKDAANLYNFEVANGLFKSTDNNFKIDAKNKTIDIIF